MYDYILSVTNYLLHLSDLGCYIFLFCLLMTGALGFPPEDITLITGGILASRGQGDIFIIGLICYVGAIVGDCVIYVVGRWFGKTLYKKEWFKKRLPPERIEQIKRSLEKRSISMIFLARHLFYLRTATFLVCGSVKMRFSAFLLSDAIAGLVSVPLMLLLGMFAAEHYDEALKILSEIKFWAIIVGIALLLGVYIYWKRKCPANINTTN